MKIAQIVCTFPPYRGGLGNSVKDLAEMLAKQGNEVTVFTPNYKKITTEYNGVFKVKRLRPLFKFGNAAVLPQLFWLLSDFDVIHLHLPFLGATLPVVLFSTFHPKKKIIVTYHMDLIAAGWKKYFFNYYQKFCVPAILGRAKKIIVSSFDYAEYSAIAAYFKKHKNKFAEIPFCVDTAHFAPRPKDVSLLEKYFISPQEKIILFVGGLDAAHYFKGLEVLMKSFKTLLAGNENLRLLVVGNGELAAHYKDMAHALNISDKIIFAENVSDADLPAHYNLADVFVLPSITKSEAFGIVLLEAAASGKPLAASNLAGVRTVVRDGVNGFLSLPGDADDLAEKIKIILNNDELRRNFGAAAKRDVDERYQPEVIAAKWREIYG
jgi:glycosyltransferase involved in cell wall biosynthesis